MVKLSQFIIPFFIAFLLSLLFTYLIRRLALYYKILDYPSLSRKIHKKSIPLLGGLGIFLAFTCTLGYYALFTDRILDSYILGKHLWGILLGGMILMIGGILDDKFSLKPWQQFIFPFLAVLVVIASGIGINCITNPLGGTIKLDTVKWPLFTLNGLPYQITLFADLFTLVWLLGMIYTTKFLDGLDGLVSGICTIGSVVLFFLSLRPEVMQPETAMLCIILAGCALGFLIFNFHPAKIFLGEGGSIFLGFALGTLAIISGGKIATALLVMGIPILDLVWVVVRRAITKRSPFLGDRKHLHFRLLDIGFSHRQAVLFLWFWSACFGVTAIFLEGKAKLVSLGVLVLIMIILAMVLVWLYKRKKQLTSKTL